MESLSGTLNGIPISLAQAPAGLGSWLYPETYPYGSIYYELGGIWFTSDGSCFWLENDIGYNLLEGNDGSIAMEWTATDTVVSAEPSSLLLLGMGVAALLIGLARRNHAKGQKAIVQGY